MVSGQTKHTQWITSTVVTAWLFQETVKKKDGLLGKTIWKKSLSVWGICNGNRILLPDYWDTNDCRGKCSYFNRRVSKLFGLRDGVGCPPVAVFDVRL